MRIARGRPEPDPVDEALTRATDPYAPVSLPPHGNIGGLKRARRLLYLYLLLLAVLYAGVVVLVAGSRYAAIRTDVALYAVLSVIASISALAGFWLTVGRAPWAVYVAVDDLVVRERFGAVRRFPLDDTLRIDPRGRQPQGFLSPRPTETVRVSSSRVPAREYVLDEGLLDDIPELAPYRARR